MTIFEFVSSSGGVADDDLEDFDIFYAATHASASEEAKGYFVASAEDNVHVGLLLPNDAAFISLAQYLGYPGDDEQGAMAFILRLQQPELNATLGRAYDSTFLDEILSVHWFRALSDDVERIPFKDLQEAGGFTTLGGTAFSLDGNTIVVPGRPTPHILPSEVDVSNGLVKLIDQVLLPFIPDRNALGFDSVLAGTEMRDRLFGGDGNDLLIDGAGGDILHGGGGEDTFLLTGDSSRDKILDFEPGHDVIELSNWDIWYIEELFVKQRNDSSLLISDGRNSAVLQAADGQISVEDLGSDSLIFGPGPSGTWIWGSDGRDRLQGTNGDDVFRGGLGRDFLTGGRGADTFYAGTDTFDLITDYKEGFDRIALQGWGVTEFSELSISQLRPWLLQVTSGDFELRVRGADRDIDPEDMSAEDFILFG